MKRVKRDISIIFVILGFSLELKIKSQVFLTNRLEQLIMS